MKNLLFILAFFISLQVVAQEEDDGYVMYQLILLTPKDGQRQQLQEGLKAHNDKFHQEGAQSVNVWSIRTGSRAGSLLWVKGPLTWTDMDTPLSANGHMDDWRANVTPHAVMGEFEFWRLLDGMSYMPDGFTPELVVMRYFDIKPQKGDNARDIWDTGFKLYNEKNWDTGLQIYSNQANTGDGRDWAIVWFHENWASLDVDRNFFSTYEEMYDVDRSEYFERWSVAAKFKGMEILTLIPELSAVSSE